MKTIGMTLTSVLAAGALMTALPAWPQAQSDEAEVAEGRAMVEAGRRELVAAELRLSEEESAAFWPVYDEYRGVASDISDRYTAMVMRYVDRYNAGDLDDAYADRLLGEYFAIRRELLDVRMDYIDRFKAVLPSLKVAQFYQLENKINAEIDAQLALAIPLISE